MPLPRPLTSVCTRRAWVSRGLQGGRRFASPAHPAPPLTLAGDTRSVMRPIVSPDIGFALAVCDRGVVGPFGFDHSIVHVVAYGWT